MVKNLIISELERILFRKKTLVLFLIYLGLIVGFGAFLSFFDIGFYNRETPAELNNLNLPLLVVKEAYFVFSLLILPLLFIDSFSAEISSGSYRLIMLRSASRFELLLSKIISQFIIVFSFLTSGFLVSLIYSILGVKSVQTVSILDQENLTQVEALLYTAKFYGILFIISISIMIISYLVCTVFSNTVLNLLIILGILLGSLYISSAFAFFLIAGEYTFNLLNNGNSTFFLINATIIVMGFLIVNFIWRKKDVYD